MKKRMKIKVLSAVVCMLLLAGGFQAVEGNAREAGSAEATETAVETTSDQTARETEESAGTAVNLQGSLMMLTESAEAKEAPASGDRRRERLVSDFLSGEDGLCSF